MCKHASSTAEFPFPLLVKTADLMFQNIFVPKQYNDGDNTGYFLTAGNEVMKPILLLCNSFRRM